MISNAIFLRCFYRGGWWHWSGCSWINSSIWRKTGNCLWFISDIELSNRWQRLSNWNKIWI